MRTLISHLLSRRADWVSCLSDPLISILACLHAGVFRQCPRCSLFTHDRWSCFSVTCHCSYFNCRFRPITPSGPLVEQVRLPLYCHLPRSAHCPGTQSSLNTVENRKFFKTCNCFSNEDGCSLWRRQCFQCCLTIRAHCCWLIILSMNI